MLFAAGSTARCAACKVNLEVPRAANLVRCPTCKNECKVRARRFSPPFLDPHVSCRCRHLPPCTMALLCTRAMPKGRAGGVVTAIGVSAGAHHQEAQVREDASARGR